MKNILQMDLPSFSRYLMKYSLTFLILFVFTSNVFSQECDETTRARMIKQGISDKTIEKECGKIAKSELVNDLDEKTNNVSSKRKKRNRFGWTFRNCGLGAMIFDRSPVGAAISNVTWDCGTSASSTSSSSPESCAGEERLEETAVLKFIRKNYVNLIQETSQGFGDHTIALSGLLGCKHEGRKTVLERFRNNDLNKYFNSYEATMKNTINFAVDFEYNVDTVNNCL